MSSPSGKTALLATLVTFLLLCALGFWQLHRLQWKENLLRQLDAEYAKDAGGLLLEPEDIDQDFDFKRATLKGEYDFEKQVFIGPRVYKNLPGKHVYTPLKLKDGSHILVNRGWVPNEWQSADELPLSKTEAQKGAVTGLLRRPGSQGFAPDNKPDKEQWYFADPNQIADAKNIPAIQAHILYLEGSGPEGNYPIPSATRPDLPNSHLQYAIFWFAMASILLVIAFLRFKKG